MLIVKLTRTQILQQERKIEEEKQKLKTARKSVKPKAVIKRKTTVNVTQNNAKKEVSTETLPNKILSPKIITKSPLVQKVANTKSPRKSIPKRRVTPGKTNNRNTKSLVGVRFRKVKVTKRKSPTVRKVARKGKLRPRVVSKAVPKKKVGTGKPTVPAKKPVNGSKASTAAKIEKEGKAEEEKKVEKAEKKTTDCCCSEKDGEEVQSCWMCRLSQRLGGKLIGNKIKTK